MTSIKGVLFDLDGTLLNRELSLRNFLACQWTSCPDLQHAPQDEFIRTFIELDDNGRVWKDVVYDRIVYLLDIPNMSSASLLKDYTNQFRHHASLHPGALHTIEHLREQGMKTGIVTNGLTDFQKAVIRTCDLERHMDIIIVSEEAGVRKPDPAIFAKAVAALDLKAEQCAFVGDNPEADIAGARAYGMHTIWYANTFYEQPRPSILSATIQEFRSLPEVIDSL